MIKACPKNWHINASKNRTIIELIVWGISCCSKIKEIIIKIIEVIIPEINIIDVVLYFFLN